MNAVLNSVSTVLLLCGYRAMKQKRIAVHRRFMISAFVVSALFMIGYVAHKVLLYQATGSWNTPFGGEGIIRVVYFVILASHVLLSLALPVFVPVTLYRGLRMNVARHKAIARFVFPVWLYVSVTGVLVYMMLYQWFPKS